MAYGKVALEEHVVLHAYESAVGSESSENPDWWDPTYAQEVDQRLPDASRRLEEMDRCGIQTIVLSQTTPGIQAISDAAQAVELARRINDELAEHFVAAYRQRFAGFAALPLQDPQAAGDELERAVRELGFKGALINGYSNIGDADTAQYLDEAPVWEFWARVAALEVPVYLHPRLPLSSQQRMYAGYPALTEAPWGFGVETGTHALRLMLSGPFDRFPGLTIILGHLGEGLPFLLPRVEHRLRHTRSEARPQRPVTQYLRENFYVTTAGAFRTSALLDTLLEIGADRVLFSVDYPYETPEEQTEWFESVPISEHDRQKIGGANARRLLRLS
jgi:2,3-dihydroxybenzoate decarboxylase